MANPFDLTEEEKGSISDAYGRGEPGCMARAHGASLRIVAKRLRSSDDGPTSLYEMLCVAAEGAGCDAPDLTASRIMNRLADLLESG